MFSVNIYRAEGKDVQVVTLNDLCKVQWFINQDFYIQTHTDDLRDSVSRVLVNSKMTFHSDICFKTNNWLPFYCDGECKQWFYP